MSILVYRSQFPFTRDARVRWMLEELGVAYTTETVMLLADTAQYKKVNPRGKVPFFVGANERKNGETVAISESGAILLHLAEEYDEGGKLLPKASLDRARVYQWLFHTVSDLDPVMASIFANKYFRAGQDGAEAAAAASEETFARLAIHIESALDGNDYLVGNAFSIADIALGVTLEWGARVGVLAKYPRLAAYHGHLAARPSLTKVLLDSAPAQSAA